MLDEHHRTLFLPVARGDVPPPTSTRPALVFGAGRGLRLPAGMAPSALVCVQPFRPDWLALRNAGHDVHPVPPTGVFDSAFVLASRYRARTEAWIEEALGRLAPGGWLVVAGGLKDGADSLARRLAKRFPGGERMSKHHGVAFFAQLAEPAGSTPAHTATVEGWTTAAGAFSADRIDPASRLLVESLPEDLSGRIADFGAGWGYLAGEIAARFPGVCHVDLYEADFLALAAAKENLVARASTTEAGFFWIDLATETVSRRYDAIVMNPPFHEGRAADPALGRALIDAAAKALKPGGRLFLVANRPLPYEATLASTFARSGEIIRDARYKVLWAAR